jgi:methyltransferase
VPASELGTSFWAFALLFAAVGVLRVLELVVSARRTQQRQQKLVSEPALFPAMVLLHVGLLTAPCLEVWLGGRPLIPALAIASGVVLVLATALRVATLRALGRAWNVRVVVPAETAVVTDGPYRWIRHPNYLVVILEILALPLIHTAWVSALALSLLNAVILWRRIRTEEAALSELPAWREAMADRKRLIPGVF